MADADANKQQLLADLRISCDGDETMRLMRLMQRTPEWHDARRFRLTASDCAAVLNLDQYLSAPELVERKIRGPTEPNAAQQHGIANEAAACAQYMLQNPDVVVKQVGLLVHSDMPWLGASPDGLLVDRATGQPVGVLELKAPHSKQIPVDVHPSHRIQVLVQLFLLQRMFPNCRRAEVMYFVPPATTRTFRITITDHDLHNWRMSYFPRYDVLTADIVT